MRRPALCICKNKGADQRNCAADQHLCFCYIDSAKPLLTNSENIKPPAIFCGFTAGFVLDLVGSPKDMFSDDVAQI